MWLSALVTCFVIRHTPPRACESRQQTWNVTASGVRYIDEIIGDRGYPRAYIGVRYNLSNFVNDELIETSGSRPVGINVNDTIWKGVLSEMQLGGKRSVLLSPADLQRSDIKIGTTLKLDVELTELGAWRFLPTRRRLLLVMYLLTFLPYFLPPDERPGLFRPRESRFERWMNDAEFWRRF